MALLHQADLNPTKLELLAAWLPTRAWYPGPAGAELKRIAAYRFDDPEGEVGIETILVRAGDGPLVQAPLTYRGAPLPDAEAFLIGTTDHSVLGKRWVYEACGDPVYVNVLTTVMRTGGGQAEEFVEVNGEPVRRETPMVVTGSGTDAASPTVAIARVADGDPTLIVTDGPALSIPRILNGTADVIAGALTLTGTWPGQATPVLLATAS
jgi:Maltokinase N-terminal cap domain